MPQGNTNMVNQVIIVLFCVTVTFATQSWEEEPGYKEVNPGGEVTLFCRVKNKKGECRWERDNTPIAEFPGKYEWAGDQKAGDCSLRILQANLDYDNGGWVCQVTASSFKERDTLISQPAKLVVRAPPTSVHLRIPGESSPFTGPLVATSTTPVTVECRSKGGNPPPALHWYIGGERWQGAADEITEQDGGSTVSRVNVPVSKADNGKEVRCEVVHEALSSLLDTRTQLDVQYVPTATLSLMEDITDYAEGDNVNIKCLAESNPPANIIWYRDGSGEIVSRKSLLQIEGISKDQAGIYVCQANNTVGQSSPKKVDIEVKYQPVITSVGPHSKVDQLLTGKVKLTCKAHGNPPPIYTWIQHNEQGPNTRGHESVLVIDRLTYHDQGEYECRAKNIIHGKEHIVKSSPITVNVTGAPKVRERRSEVFILKGTDARVSVEFCADPLPKQSWHMAGPTPGTKSILFPGTSHLRFSVKKEKPGARKDCYISTLTIDKSELGDSQDFELHLENEHGHIKHTVHVSIGEMLAQETLIGGIIGAAATILLIVTVLVFCCRRSCKSEKDLKKEMERSV